MKYLSLIINLTILLILCNHSLRAQIYEFDSLYRNNDNFRSQFEATPDFNNLFSSDVVMEIKIASDFKNLIKKKGKEEYQPAVFQYMVNDSVLLTREITIRARGLSRKNICFFPPIKLNFPDDEEILPQFKEFNKLKMVMDCKRGEVYEQYLLSEFMAYKLLNVLTDYSYRVRLIRVTYLDTSGKFNPETKYAFLIENKKQMAERLNCIPIDVKGVKDELIEKASLVNAYLFQYMIGNTDWSIPGSHNMHLLKSKDPVKTAPYVVPYDFDLAGIVDANYAFPNEELGIGSVRERLYMGICLPESEIKEGLEIFLERKDDIFGLYQNSELLYDDNKRKTMAYLEEFYDIVENESKMTSSIIDSCLK